MEQQDAVVEGQLEPWVKQALFEWWPTVEEIALDVYSWSNLVERLSGHVKTATLLQATRHVVEEKDDNWRVILDSLITRRSAYNVPVWKETVVRKCSILEGEIPDIPVTVCHYSNEWATRREWKLSHRFIGQDKVWLCDRCIDTVGAQHDKVLLQLARQLGLYTAAVQYNKLVRMDTVTLYSYIYRCNLATCEHLETGIRVFCDADTMMCTDCHELHKEQLSGGNCKFSGNILK